MYATLTLHSKNSLYTNRSHQIYMYTASSTLRAWLQRAHSCNFFLRKRFLSFDINGKFIYEYRSQQDDLNYECYM